VIRFEWNGREVEVAASPTTTLLQWLRQAHGGIRDGCGTKEGCAEGDCGACTVAILEEGNWRAINACLVLLPMVHGRRLVTVEGLADADPHPVQAAMVAAMGSQCGYCTPGFVMSLFEACYRTDMKAPWQKDDQLCGNLCRCTGYRPIRDALEQVAGLCPADRFRSACEETEPPVEPLEMQYGSQRFFAPTRLDEALSILQKEPQIRVVAGATDLGLDVTQRHVAFPALLSVERVRELRRISSQKGVLSIGAATPLSELEAWSEQRLPVLHRMLRYFGSRQIKHRATIGGNLCNASPIGDLAPVLLMLDASLELASAQGARSVPIAQWFTGYRKTALQPGELLAHIHVPLPSPTARHGAYKVSRRRELDISAVSGAFRVELDEQGRVTLARFAYGGMAATPVRVTLAEQAVMGLPWNPEAVKAAQQAVDGALSPMDDHRGSAWFRRTLARNLLRGFFLETEHAPFVPLPDRHTGTVVLP
jgi:xanthine dehydrogenase small subunit